MNVPIQQPLSRTPNDGKPYYCKGCGLGFGEFIACEEEDCELEDEETALARKSVNGSSDPA